MPRNRRGDSWADDAVDGDGSGPRIRKVRSVRLLRADDADYLAAMAGHAVANRRLGEKQDPGATYRASRVIEAAALDWLADRAPLRPERVIAADVLPTDARAYERLYLELDAVTDLPDGGLRVHEVKFTTSPNAFARGFRQLRRAARLLATAWPRVETLLVAVPADGAGYERDDPRLADVTWLEPGALDARIGSRAVLLLGLGELEGRLDSDGRALLAAARAESEGVVRQRRERRDRIAAGEVVEDTRRPRRPAATVAFGDEADRDGAEEASPFAVLARLRTDADEP